MLTYILGKGSAVFTMRNNLLGYCSSTAINRKNQKHSRLVCFAARLWHRELVLQKHRFTKPRDTYVKNISECFLHMLAVTDTNNQYASTEGGERKGLL